MMAEDSDENGDREWSRFWQTASRFWWGLASWRVWLLCAFLVAIVALQLYVQFRFNYWNRDFFDALESRDPTRLRSQAVLLIPLCAGSVALAVISVWGRMTMQRNWREWLSRKVIDYWVDKDRYARLATVPGEQQIPEYRIAEDVRIATDAPIDFALGLISSLLTAAIFVQVLWEVGGPIEVVWYGHDVWIPGYLVVGVAVYSGLVTSAMLWVGHPLPRAIQIKNQSEAELITAAHLLRDIGEGVTPRGQEASVTSSLWQALQHVIKQWVRLCWLLMRTTMVSHLNTLLAPIIGLVLCAPKFLAGAMTLGELTQSAAAFVTVQSAFNWLVDNYPRLADWTASARRAASLLIALDELEAKENAKPGPAQP